MNRVTIEVEARFTDGVSAGAKKATAVIEDLGQEAEQSAKKVEKMGRKKPLFDADTSKFMRKLREAEKKADLFGRKKTLMTLKAIDKASTVIGKVLNKAQSFGGKVWTGLLKMKDSNATRLLKNVRELGKGIAGKTWTAIVKIKDLATSPLTKLKNSLFSIKTLIGGIVAGAAIKTVTQQGILQPIGLADAYSGAKIGFSTLLGEERGQQMMDDLDQFAKTSPFNSSGVISNAQKMLAMGWDAESIVKDMETIGNAAASTGNLDQGLESIVRAMAQIKTKGKLSAEELNQLAEAGISAKAMLAEELGYGTGDEALAKFSEDQEDGLIGADKALQALLRGMKRYDGMMDSMANETAQGLMAQLKDTFEINILRRWGQGLQDGAKRGLGSVMKLLDSAEDSLEKLGDTIYEVGKELSNWAADKLEKAVKTIQEVTGSEEFQNAGLGGKISILWDEVIAKPFSEWWDSKGKPLVAKKMGEFGQSLGRGISDGLLAMLGIQPGGALADGASIGASFAQGFAEGFDGEAVGEAIWNAIKKGLKNSAYGLMDLLLPGDQGASGGQKAMGIGAGLLGAKYLPGLLGGAWKLGKGAFDTGSVLTGAKGLADVGTGSGLMAQVIGNAGSATVGGTGLTGLASSAGYALTGGAAASTLTGGAAALLGGGSILGGILGAGGIISGITDLVRGHRSDDKKDKKTKLFSGGSKLGMVGTGAGIGAGIGTLVAGPAGTAVGGLLGAGVGGVAAMWKGSDLGKWLSDATDEGGALDNMKKSVSKFFSETLPEKWNEFWDSVGKFFTETIPAALEPVGEAITTYFTETLPEGWSKIWDAVGNFFTEKIPYGIGFVHGKIEVFFTETLPEAWSSFWEAVGNFFTETIPTWAGNIHDNYIVPFFTETLPNAWDSFWSAIGTFFTETVPTWAEGVWNNNIVPFFTTTLPNAWNSFWSAIGAFFTETIPTWAEDIHDDHIVPFFEETLPNFFGQVWDGICTFFDETLPSIRETIWSGIINFFTVTIPGWVNSALESAGGWFSEKWDNFTSGFNKGRSDAGAGDTSFTGGGRTGGYRGGIFGGDSAMDSFATGGRPADGMLKGTTKLIRVNEEYPEMIIPLSSQRRDRGLKLWNKAGQLLGVPGFARGGVIGQEPAPLPQFGGGEETGTGGVVVDVGGVNVQIHVTASENQSIAEAIRAQASEIAETVAGIMADALGQQFENTPLRGGA